MDLTYATLIQPSGSAQVDTLLSQFEFRISKALKDKPATPTSPQSVIPGGLTQRPGSDINTQGLEVGRLGRTHFLAFNGFSSYRPHYLLLTLNAHRRQWEPLDIDDFRAVHAFLDTYGRGCLIFFNCGVKAGCSRVHKHLQAIPKESFEKNPWHNIDGNESAVPFAWFRQTLGSEPGPEGSLRVYMAGLEAVERTLKHKTTEEDGAPPHNMIMDAERMVVIPRRSAGIGSVGANAGGMLGMIWTQSEEATHRWLDAGPQNVLERAGLPTLL